MPFKKLMRAAPPPQAEQLQQRLIEEWRQPEDKPGAPIIIEESHGPNAPIRVYVVWDDWHPLTPIQRSEIVMDVYELLHDADRASRVTATLGLTPDEARGLGIHYQ